MITKALMKKKPLWWKYLLIPFFPFIALWFFILFLLTPPHLRNGIHCITADTGGSKTLLAHIISQKYKDKWTVFSNSKFNNDVKVIDIFDFFNNYEIVKPIENGIVIFDEIQKDFNKRLNRRNDYNEIFIPLIEWLTTRRHHNVPKVYFITQSWDMLDTQLQRIIEKVHFLTGKKKQVFKAWLRTPKVRPLIAPKSITYYTRRRKDMMKSDIETYVSRKKELKYRKVRKYTVNVTIDDLIGFDTYAFKPSAMKAVKEAKEKRGQKNGSK